MKVSAVEVKHVDLPPEMQRAMAKQAEAEREKRAKIIHASGEYEAAEQLGMAAEKISANPTTLQLRYLQTLTEIATEKNSTIIFPMPIDLFQGLIRRPGGGTGVSDPAGRLRGAEITRRALQSAGGSISPEPPQRGAAAAHLPDRPPLSVRRESDIDRLARRPAPDDPWRREIAALDLSALRTGSAPRRAPFIAPPRGTQRPARDSVVVVVLFEEGHPTGLPLLGRPR